MANRLHIQIQQTSSAAYRQSNKLPIQSLEQLALALAGAEPTGDPMTWRSARLNRSRHQSPTPHPKIKNDPSKWTIAEIRRLPSFGVSGYRGYSDKEIQEAIDTLTEVHSQNPIPIYRGIILESSEDFEKDSLGQSWAYTYDAAMFFISDKIADMPDEYHPYIIEATIDRSAVDWIEALRRHFQFDEKELPIPRENQKKIKIDSIRMVDR